MVGKPEFKRDRKKTQKSYKKHLVDFMIHRLDFININGDQYIIRHMMEIYVCV